MLHPGERFGTGAGPALDLVVDPVDGTRLAASGRPGAMAILAVGAARVRSLDLGPAHYLDKLVHARTRSRRPRACDRCRSPRTSPGSPPSRGRPRRRRCASPCSRVRAMRPSSPRPFAARGAAARVRARRHRAGRCTPRHPAASLDLLLGIGGAPEGVLEAAIVRAHGGVMQAAFAPQSPREAARLAASGIETRGVLDLDALCAASAFVAIAPVTPCAIGPARATLVEVDGGPIAPDLPVDDPA